MSIHYAKKKKKSIVGTFKIILKTCEFLKDKRIATRLNEY